MAALIHFATTNKGKLASASRALSDYGIAARGINFEIPEPRSFDLKEIAHAKARFAYSRLRRPCIVQDSGFYIASLRGFPRTYVHFVLDTIGTEGILAITRGRSRACSFRACLTYYDGKRFYDFTSEYRGSISESERGSVKPFHWPKIFLIFIPEGSTKTLAEMSRNDYMRWYDIAKSKSEFVKFGSWYSRKIHSGAAN